MSKIIAVCFSSGMLKMNNLEQFFPELAIISNRWKFSNRTAVIGWGFKSTAKKARDYAKEHNLPYIALEDGFLRSIGLGVEGAVPASLIIDYTGIYYESRQTSSLEQLILGANNLPDSELARARLCINAIKLFRLSKYNLKSQQVNFLQQPKVVVIDQTQGDASVKGALADKQTFLDMLNVALAEHPNETIWVKVHPDVLTGKKQGFLYPLPFQHERIKLCSESVNPWLFLDSVTDLYTVSSLMGFEALMASVKVHCFGMPFYAGWGLTEDKLDCARRGSPRSIEQIFVATYIQYARYVDPIFNQQCEIEDIINYFSDQVSVTPPVEEASLFNISWWKQRWIGDFTDCWVTNVTKASNRKLVWGMPKLATDNEGPISRVEDGFIRSIGLGVHFNRPISLVCDHSGIYFDARKSSDLEVLLNSDSFSEWHLARARKIISSLNSLRLTKYNIGNEFDIILPEGKKIILVPGQVEQDASIRFGSPKIKTNAALLLKVRDNNPQAYIIYKPHPDVVAGQRDGGSWQGDYLDAADIVVQDCSMSSLLDKIDEVHTMTSLAGFEALLRTKVVHTYGLPFYAGWGLTSDFLDCPRRQKKRTLEELVVATLILYPTYVDPVSRQPCSVEQAIKRLSQLKNGDIQIKDNKLKLLLAIKYYKKQIKKWLI